MYKFIYYRIKSCKCSINETVGVRDIDVKAAYVMTTFPAETPSDCDDSCVTCCCNGCAMCGYAFCVKKMRRSVRIKLLFVYLSILCFTLASIFGFVIFGPYNYSFTATDIRWTKSRISNIFCDTVTITSSGGVNSSFSAYLIGSDPRIDQDNRQSFKTEATSFIEVNSYIYHKFYLLNGSMINVSVCADSFVQMYSIKGEHNFKTFIDQQLTCDDCIQVHYSLSKMKCNKPSDFTQISFTASDTSEYYLIYSSLLDSSWLTSKYDLNRTLYDVSDALHFYSSVNKCQFPLQLSKKEQIIIHRDASDTLENTKIETSCSVRIWIYVVFFFIGPYFAGVILCALIYKHCKDPITQENIVPSSVDIRTPLLYGSDRYYSTTVEPPKYEDIIRTEDGKPPTYSEAIGLIN